MLKKTILALGFIAAGIGSSGLAQAADDGTIHFTGTILASACSVSSVAGSGTTAGTVAFGQVSSAALAGAGDATAAVPFSIELTHCAVDAAPDITFKGPAVTTTGYTSLFTSQVPGVGIRLEDAGNIGSFYTPGVAAANSGFSGLKEGVASATGRFNAYLVAYNQGNYTGSINTDVTFVLDYSES